MDSKEYRQRGKEMVDYIADYLDTVASRRVFPDVRPGFLHAMLPESAPLDGEPWDQIMADVDRVIMPGVTHWQSPHMHAYFPALNSYPSLLGDMLADAINCLGFTWASSPACTELETVVMNWLGKMIGLPEEFLQLSGESTGGGVIQTTSSESTLVCLLAGRTRAIKRIQESNPELEDAEVNARLVAYCSDQAHSSVEKAGLIGLVRMRYIEADENMSLRGERVKEALQKDRAKGLIPFWLCASLGTTGACSFDNLQEIGPICQAEGLWLHIDAAYAGSAFVCPEFRHWIKGIELADSIAFNPSKWLMVHFDCTALWVKNSKSLHSTFNVNPIYLQHENTGHAIDYMHWQIPLSRRFRALKLWFVLRNYGVKGLQKHIREGVRLAQKFEALVLADPRFEIPAARHLGMVVFRLRGANELTERLLKSLNARGNIHCVPACLHTRYVIRFTVTSTRTTNDHIIQDWAEIRTVAKNVLIDEYGAEDGNIQPSKKNRVTLKETRELNSAFGTSLLLANSPMSPKIVDGSFVAIRDYGGLLNKFADTFSSLQIEPKDSPAMRRRIRGIMTTGKQFSLDSCMDMVQGMLASAAEDAQDLPLMSEEKEEQHTPHTSGGSSPGDKVSINSSQEPSVQEDLNCQQLSTMDSNQLTVPSQSGRHYRSRSVDTTLPGYTKNQCFEKPDLIILPESLKNFESSDASLSKGIDTVVFINNEYNELPKSSNRGQPNAEKTNGNKDKCTENVLVHGSAAKSVVLNPNVNIKHAGNDEFVQSVGKMSKEREDDERKFNKLMQEEEMDMFVPITVREKSTSGYIKRFFQQFSEQSFDSEGKGDATPGMSNEKASPIRKKVDDICKKCLHYKGQVNNNKE